MYAKDRVTLIFCSFLLLAIQFVFLEVYKLQTIDLSQAVFIFLLNFRFSSSIHQLEVTITPVKVNKVIVAHKKRESKNG